LGIRFKEHITGSKTNVPLSLAIAKYGLSEFVFVVYEFSPYLIPQILELETAYITSVPSHMLYNINLSGTSMCGYKHTTEAIAKMVARFADKTNHPMYGKTHTAEALLRISKPGAANPMFGKTQSAETRSLISAKQSHPVNVYDVNGLLVYEFPSNTLASAHFTVHKSTIGRYIVSGKLFLDKYYLRIKQPK